MIVEEGNGAQIQLILASDNKAEAIQLAHDLRNSKCSYRFEHFADRGSLLECVKRAIGESSGGLPTVIVINYDFVGDASEVLVQLARIVSQEVAIECVFTHTPKDDRIRTRLKDYGATLFDGDLEAIAAGLTLH